MGNVCTFYEQDRANYFTSSNGMNMNGSNCKRVRIDQIAKGPFSIVSVSPSAIDLKGKKRDAINLPTEVDFTASSKATIT